MDHTKALAFLETLSPMELLIVKAFYDAQKAMPNRALTDHELCEATGLSGRQVTKTCLRLADKGVMNIDYPDWDEGYWIFGKYNPNYTRG